MVTYRASRGIPETGQQQRWTVYGDTCTSSFSPLPSCLVKLSPNPNSPNLNLTWESEDIPYHDLDWPVYSILPVAESVVDYQLWDQCYLRWIPVLDIRGGGQPSIYFNQCSFVNDILSLECQLDQLQNQETPPLPTQRFVTMSDHQSTGKDICQPTSCLHLGCWTSHKATQIVFFLFFLCCVLNSCNV